MLNISSLRFSFFKHVFLQGSKKSSNFAPDFKICVIMKRIMLTLVLAIAAGVWNLNWAICMDATTPVDGPVVSISGEFFTTAMPCEEGDPCPPCITLALSANDNIYYLSTTDSVVEAQLDSIIKVLESVNCICEQPATVTGIIYTRNNTYYIAISNIVELGVIQEKKWHQNTDTIPLFINDGPGSSTVEPVDPNLIYATLSGNQHGSLQSAVSKPCAGRQTRDKSHHFHGFYLNNPHRVRYLYNRINESNMELYCCRHI